jgi:hypothetical protein
MATPDYKRAELELEEAKAKAEEEATRAHELNLEHNREEAEAQKATLDAAREKREAEEARQHAEREKVELDNAAAYAQREKEQVEQAEALVAQVERKKKTLIRQRFRDAVQMVEAQEHKRREARKEMDKRLAQAKRDGYDLLRKELVENNHMSPELYKTIATKMEEWRKANPSGALSLQDLIAAWVYSMGPGEVEDGAAAPGDSEYEVRHGFSIYSEFNASMREMMVPPAPGNISVKTAETSATRAS